MLRDIIRRKMAERVRDILEEIDIEQILEEKVEEKLDDYDIEDIVINNVESIADEYITEIFDDDGEDMIDDVIGRNFDINEW